MPDVRRHRHERRCATRALELTLGDSRYVDDLRAARHAARRAPPRRPRPGRRRRASTSRRPRGARRRRRAHRRRRPGRAAGRSDPQGLADLHPGGRPHVLPRRRARHGGRRGPRDRARRGPARRGRRTGRCSPITDARGRDRHGAETPCGASTATCCRARRTRGATSTPRSPASAHVVHEVFQTQRIEHAFLEPESTLVAPVLPATGPTGCTCTPAARACGTTATRSRRCSASTRERVTVELVVERRRLRRQGGHGQPGPDRARGLAAAAGP